MVNAKITSNQSPKFVNSTCVLVDYCAGLILEAPPGTRFRVRGNLDGEIFLSVRDVARKCHLAEKTIYCWIETERLRAEHGLRMLGRSIRIDWVIFEACIDRGDFAGSDASCS